MVIQISPENQKLKNFFEKSWKLLFFVSVVAILANFSESVPRKISQFLQSIAIFSSSFGVLAFFAWWFADTMICRAAIWRKIFSQPKKVKILYFSTPFFGKGLDAPAELARRKKFFSPLVPLEKFINWNCELLVAERDEAIFYHLEFRQKKTSREFWVIEMKNFAPSVNFSISREGLLSKIFKKDIEIGDPELDNKLKIVGNDEFATKSEISKIGTKNIRLFFESGGRWLIALEKRLFLVIIPQFERWPSIPWKNFRAKNGIIAIPPEYEANIAVIAEKIDDFFEKLVKITPQVAKKF